MKRFYNLLVRDLSTDTDPDLDKIRKSNTADIKAIRNEFRNSKSFKINLAMTCVLKFILSLLFGIWNFWVSRYNLSPFLAHFKIVSFQIFDFPLVHF